MYNKGSLVAITILLGFIVISHQTETVKISLYYETYCPDCINFVQGQLAPLMGEFNRYPDWLVLDLIPYGKAQETKNGLICQHGPKECLGNKLHACAIDRLVTHQKKPHYMKLVNFMYCVMNEDDQIYAAYKCALQTSVNYARLIRCYVDGTGDRLIEYYGNRTADLKPALKWVPTIVFNDVFNQTENDAAQKDLYKVVCTYNPEACQ